MTEIKVPPMEDVKFPNSSFTICKSNCDDLVVVFERNGKIIHLYLRYDKHEDGTRLYVEHASCPDSGELAFIVRNFNQSQK